MNKFSEKKLEGEIRKYFISRYHKYQDIVFWKNHGNGFTEEGRHDLFVCFKGRFISIEVKGTNNNYGVTQAQLEQRDKIVNAGGIVFLAGVHFITIEDFIFIWERTFLYG